MAKGCSEKTEILSRIAAVVVIFDIAVALSVTYHFTSNRLNENIAESLK